MSGPRRRSRSRSPYLTGMDDGGGLGSVLLDVTLSPGARRSGEVGTVVVCVTSSISGLRLCVVDFRLSETVSVLKERIE